MTDYPRDLFGARLNLSGMADVCSQCDKSTMERIGVFE